MNIYDPNDRDLHVKKRRTHERETCAPQDFSSLYLLGSLRGSFSQRSSRNERRSDRKLSPKRRLSDLPLIGPNRMPPDIKMAA